MNFSDLVGKTLVSVERKTATDGDDEIVFITNKGDVYKQYHCQDCCESVTIEDICGDLSDLVGNPIITASEDSNQTDKGICDSETWTFYNISTIKGHVTIRWLGTSNGYYSESVDFVKVDI